VQTIVWVTFALGGRGAPVPSKYGPGGHMAPTSSKVSWENLREKEEKGNRKQASAKKIRSRKKIQSWAVEGRGHDVNFFQGFLGLPCSICHDCWLVSLRWVGPHPPAVCRILIKWMMQYGEREMGLPSKPGGCEQQ
jgi:hypothetical protein